MFAIPSGLPIQAFYPAFAPDPELCQVETLTEIKGYAPAKPIRPVRKPHNPVKAVTIGHWLKKRDELAGIDTDVYSVHSTRGVATSIFETLGQYHVIS